MSKKYLMGIFVVLILASISVSADEHISLCNQGQIVIEGECYTVHESKQTSFRDANGAQQSGGIPVYEGNDGRLFDGAGRPMKQQGSSVYYCTTFSCNQAEFGPGFGPQDAPYLPPTSNEGFDWKPSNEPGKGSDWNDVYTNPIGSDSEPLVDDNPTDEEIEITDESEESEPSDDEKEDTTPKPQNPSPGDNQGSDGGCAGRVMAMGRSISFCEQKGATGINTLTSENGKTYAQGPCSEEATGGAPCQGMYYSCNQGESSQDCVDRCTGEDQAACVSIDPRSLHEGVFGDGEEDSEDKEDKKKKKRKWGQSGPLIGERRNWWEGKQPHAWQQDEGLCNERYGPNGCEQVFDEETKKFTWERAQFECDGNLPACLQECEVGSGNGAVYECECAGAEACHRKDGKKETEEWAENLREYRACLELTGDSKQCQREYKREFTNFFSTTSFSGPRAGSIISGWTGYDEAWNSYLNDRIDSKFAKKWFSGDFAGGLVDSVCKAPQRQSAGSGTAVMTDSNFRAYAHVEGEYALVEEGPQNLDRPYVYKFTFAVNPTDCETEFSFFVKDGGKEIPIFIKGGNKNRAYKMDIGGDRENEDRVEEALTMDTLSWGPGVGHETLPEWQLFPGRNPHEEICLEFTKGCFPEKLLCSKIKFAEEAYTAGSTYSGSDEPGTSTWDDDDDDDDDDGGPEGPSLNPDL